MKKSIILGFFLMATWITYGQEYKAKFANASDRKLVLNLFNSEVKVEGYDGDEVAIQARGYEPPPKRADGLKPLSAAGVDNSGIGLSIINEGNTIKITKASRGDGEYVIKVPKKVSIIYDESNWHDGGDDVNISNIDGEIEVNAKNGKISLTNVSGPVVANSISGDIIIVFSSYNTSKPSAISAISGFVDVTLPDSTKANLKLKTISGEIYSNIDVMVKNKEGLAHVGGSQVEGSINGGGADINISAISGDVYLRKGK